MGRAGRAIELTRRAAIVSLVAGGAAFAAFGPSGRRGVPSGRRIIDYWEKWTGHEGRAMQRVVDDFNASQDRLFVRYFTTAAIDQKSLISIAGGDPPDVVGIWSYNVPAFAEGEAVLPLDDLAAAHSIHLEQYARGVRPAMQHPDATGTNRLWAMVNTAGTIAVYYNKAHFREVGLDPDRPPLTVAGIVAASERLDRRASNGDIERAGFMHLEPGWWSWIWGFGFGGRLYDPTTRAITTADPSNVRAFEWMQATVRRYGLDEIERFRSGFGNYDSAMNAFLTGRVSMVVQGPWIANVIKRYAPDLDYGAAPLPSENDPDPDSPLGAIDTDVLVIPRGARDPEASMEFIAYTQRPSVVEFLSTAHGKMSPLALTSDAFTRDHPNRAIRVHAAIAASERAFMVPRLSEWPIYKDEMDAAMQRIWGLTEAPEAALSRVAKRVQQAVDIGTDRRRRRQERHRNPQQSARVNEGRP